MEDISAWQAFLGTYQSLADWIKALWLIVPPVFILLLTALLLRAKRRAPEIDGELVYTVHRDATGQYRILRHAPPDDTPALLPLEPTHPALIPQERRGARE
ncbi:MAG: hypothetical protein ACXIVD_06120 [Salinarimonas sp.]